jgi:hypothetical protein
MKNVIGITEDKLRVHPKAEDVFENKDVIHQSCCYYAVPIILDKAAPYLQRWANKFFFKSTFADEGSYGKWAPEGIEKLYEYAGS